MFKYPIRSEKNMDQLVAYIKKEFEKGFTEELVAQKLIHAGYTEKEINHALREYHRHEQYKKTIDLVVDSAEKTWFILLLWVSAIILLTILIVLFVQYVGVDFGAFFEGKKTVLVEPETEADCAIFSHRDKERCLLKVAAFLDSPAVCVNMTSKVMKYECKTEVWNKNYCAFLILTNQRTAECS
jgi:hypothetical protein